MRGEIYPIDCKHYIPISPFDLRILEKINKIINENDMIKPPDQETPLLKQLLGEIFPVDSFHELGNSHYNILVNTKGSITAFFAKVELPNVLEHILRLNELFALSFQLGKKVIEDLNKNINLKPIEFLHLEGEGIVLSDQVNLSEMPFLKYLSIKLCTINPWKIPTLPNLEFLSIENAVIEIEPQPSLKVLCIRNTIRYEINNPEQFKKLEILSIKGAHDSNANKWIRSIPNLRELYLREAVIDRETVENLELDRLSLINVPIHTINLPIHSQIRHLTIKGCDLKTIENIPATVESLDLSNNSLTEFPKLLGNEKLQLLSLEDNQINRLSEDIILPQTLKMLNLQGNSLKMLDSNIKSIIKGIPVVIFPRIMIEETRVPTETV